MKTLASTLIKMQDLGGFRAGNIYITYTLKDHSGWCVDVQKSKSRVRETS